MKTFVPFPSCEVKCKEAFPFLTTTILFPFRWEIARFVLY